MMEKNPETNHTEDGADETAETAQTIREPIAAASRPTAAPRTIKKHDRAKAKLSVAESKIHSTDEEIEACMGKIEEDLNRFKLVEQRLVEQTLKPAQQMLKNIGAADRVLETTPAPQVDLADPDVVPVHIQNISSGRAAGWMWGLVGGVAALGGWCYTATQALGLPLFPSTFPDLGRINSILVWTAQQFGQGANAAVGGTIIVLAFLAIMGLIYWAVTSWRGASNLKLAEKIEADTEFYCTKKEECKAQMKKVRTHIGHAQKILEKYEVLLAEQNAKLRRALYVEEVDQYDRLHTQTKSDVQTIQKLSADIERFLATPMAEHGILSREGIETLEAVNKAANDYILALYA